MQQAEASLLGKFDNSQVLAPKLQYSYLASTGAIFAADEACHVGYRVQTGVSNLNLCQRY
jgi:hypothetical protein